MNKIKHQIVYWFPVYAYAIFIFYLSSVPNVFVYTPHVLRPIFMDISHIVYHIIEYMVFGFLLYRALINSNYKKAIPLAIIIAILYGVTDEIHQLFVPFRIFSLLDIISNTFGVISSQSIIYIGREILNQKGFKT